LMAVLWWLSCGSCPVVAVLWWLSCGGCPVVAVLWWLGCGDCHSRACGVVVLLFCLSTCDCLCTGVLPELPSINRWYTMIYMSYISDQLSILKNSSVIFFGLGLLHGSAPPGTQVHNLKLSPRYSKILAHWLTDVELTGRPRRLYSNQLTCRRYRVLLSPLSHCEQSHGPHSSTLDRMSGHSALGVAELPVLGGRDRAVRLCDVGDGTW
jgi:hypothetical protein